jgi:hypothetical protein
MALKLLKAYEFHRWAHREGLSEDSLCETAREIESGLVDASLGLAVFSSRSASVLAIGANGADTELS